MKRLWMTLGGAALAGGLALATTPASAWWGSWGGGPWYGGPWYGGYPYYGGWGHPYYGGWGHPYYGGWGYPGWGGWGYPLYGAYPWAAAPALQAVQPATSSSAK
jgi:hypothetical protein